MAVAAVDSTAVAAAAVDSTVAVVAVFHGRWRRPRWWRASLSLPDTRVTKAQPVVSRTHTVLRFSFVLDSLRLPRTRVC